MRLFAAEKIVNPSTGEVLYPKGCLLTPDIIANCQSIGIGQYVKTLTVLDTATTDSYWFNFLNN
jgi:hypothetical protein